MTLVNNDANHETFASVYNLLPFYTEELIMPIIEQLMLKNISKGAHILEIGCSNGQVLQQLQIRGYQTTGLDVSDELLRFAQINSPESKFILGDIRKLQSPPTYDAVYSKNVFSFFLNLEELTTVFQNVYMAMRDNALFVFSMVCADMTWCDGEPQAEDYDCTVDEKFVFIQGSYYKPEERIRELGITTFELINGNWKRSDSTVLEKDYFLSEIKESLENVGFIEINDYTTKDFGEIYNSYEERLCITCRKSSPSQQKVE